MTARELAQQRVLVRPLGISAFTLATLALIFASITVATWSRWGHVRIDAGGAIYRAAALADGAVLYRDIQSHYGPLGCYAVAALFALFGTRLLVVYGLGLCLLAGESVLLWRISRRFLSEPETALSLIAFWVLLGFQPSLFDWVVPNVFASTFAVLFATACVAALAEDVDRPTDAKLALASACAALAGLSKLEHGAAAVGALLVYCLLLRPANPRGRAKALGLGLAPGAAIALAVALALVLQVPWRVLVFDNLYGVRSLGDVLEQYQKNLFPPLSTALSLALLRYIVVLPALVIVVGVALALLRRSGARRFAGGSLLVVGLATTALLFAPRDPDLVRSVTRQDQFIWTPFVWGAIAAWASARALRGGNDRDRILGLIGAFSFLDAYRWNFRVAWAPYYAVFAPLLVVILVRTVAHWLRDEPSPWPVVLVLSACVLFGAERHWVAYRARKFALEYPRGTIYTTPREGAPMKTVIDYVREHTTPGDYVAVVPEEQLINFLAETRHPSREIGIGPGRLATTADVDRFIGELESKNTRLVVLSNRRYAEFGAGGVTDYNPVLADYLVRNFRVAIKTGQFRVLERP